MNNPFLTKIFYFNAAHQYGHDDWSDDKNWNVFGPDSKVHGHNYTLEVMVTGEVNNDTGFIVDLGHLKEVVKNNVINILDHTQFENVLKRLLYGITELSTDSLEAIKNKNIEY